ncbi:thermonuclease family protein [Phaeobacter gallaeciensis]|jgi:endonuclease YncB( thermonuclease family)|uniref:Thermonuclease family protein n=1 Tax=Phaeobacter gallaeciensis TaxID=60890 RepID=A0ABD4XER8_9RHOB|nr:thermonuclease family protein [Phaeobacter gallaeciensis]MDE4146977.1 thermonuclease family protein [Phaeobacter gallaeciensis]MDE4159562.1 thermonuclease family protein [Phaeobacter gallaeciensis]MDE4163826.1 thermonuclease family protein [Phaeobacter gallaeciensis]MDE4168017.1 thermonuclease family protein [Phaeobacter gallaeciensis]MDE4172293.1 thermonuclease family protein [Phaeobacter gallaeciensis]
MPLLKIVAALALLLSAAPVTANELVGVASVIDADTIEIRGVRIRLHGIDAPESRQLCRRSSGDDWRCGQQAALALADRIGRRTVSCAVRDVDRYDRAIAVCTQGNQDLNRWLVNEGWAVAYRRYSRDYIGAEAQARRAGRNIWAGQFVMPWDWRRGQRLP